MNRRLFLFSWFLQERPAPIQIEVMEVFSASSGPAAFLVHHANEATRGAFAAWLRANNGKSIVCRLRNGTRAEGRIFRVSLCFGRGLILISEPAAIRVKDVLSID